MDDRNIPMNPYIPPATNGDMSSPPPNNIPLTRLPHPDAPPQPDLNNAVKPVKSHKLRKFFGILILIVFMALVAFIVGVGITYTSIDKTYVVSGSGMSPTINNGDKILLAKFNVFGLNTLNTSILINDIVLYKVSFQGKQYEELQRVVAVGGDTVVISNGTLLVKDSEYPQGFNPSAGYEPIVSPVPGNINITVPKGYVYVLGDNRANSLDSETLGSIPLSSIIGKDVGTLSS